MENAVWIILSIILLFGIIYFVLLRKPGLENLNEAESERLKGDAKRFARLLIAEIKLSETYKLQRGLKNNNIYESLRDEIEEAGKKYKMRFSYDELEVYFDEALIEILADGDKTKLGAAAASLNK